MASSNLLGMASTLLAMAFQPTSDGLLQPTSDGLLQPTSDGLAFQPTSDSLPTY